MMAPSILMSLAPGPCAWALDTMQISAVRIRDSRMIQTSHSARRPRRVNADTYLRVHARRLSYVMDALFARTFIRGDFKRRVRRRSPRVHEEGAALAVRHARTHDPAPRSRRARPRFPADGAGARHS